MFSEVPLKRFFMRYILPLAILLTVIVLVGCDGSQNETPSEESIRQESSSVASTSSSYASSVSSHSGSSCGFIPTDEEKLDAQRQIWEAQDIHHYVFECTYQTDGYLTHHLNGHYRIRVVNDVVVSSLNLDTGLESSFEVSFDEIFQKASGNILYNGTYGFVKYYYNDNACVYDVMESMQITFFEALDDHNISTREYMAAYYAKIEDMISDDGCSQTQECNTIALGVKKCGGPEQYLVYSTAAVDLSQLQPLVNSYNDYSEQYNEINGSSSDCTLVLVPEVACYNNRCVEKASSSSVAASSSSLASGNAEGFSGASKWWR